MVRWKSEFGADKYGNPVWHISWARVIVIGVVTGCIFGAWVLAVEL